MSTNHTNNPGPLDEQTMLAWIEGTLDPADHRAVSQRLRGDPVLMARLDAMRLDRFNLSAMGDIPAPVGLLDGVADLLERDMLMGMGDTPDGEQQELTLPAPVQHASHAGLRRVHRRRGRLRLGRGLALAAVVVIVGVGAWVGGVLSSRAPAPPAAPGVSGLALETARDRPSISAARVEVSADTDAGGPVVEARAAEVQFAVDAEESPSHGLPPAVRAPDRLDLLREGRLVVRVRLADLSGLSWIDEVGERVPLRRDASAELIARLAPPDEPVFVESEPARLLAGDTRIGPPIDLAPPARERLPRRVVASIVLVDLPLDARTLDEAIRGLRSHRGIVSVEVDESPVSVSQDEAVRDDPFWWRRPSDQWMPRAIVPIVFEVLE